MGLERSQADAKLKAFERVVVIKPDRGAVLNGIENTTEEGVGKEHEAGDTVNVETNSSRTGVVRFDVGCVPSNEPCEDAQCQISLGKGRLLFGVFDGHNGHECAHMVSALLPSYIAHAISIIPDRDPSIAESERNQMMERAIRSAFARLDDDLIAGGVLQDPREIYSALPHNTSAAGLAVPWKPPMVVKTKNEWDAMSSNASMRQREALARRMLSPALSGSCALVAILDGQDLYVACTGDSRAVLGRTAPAPSSHRDAHGGVRGPRRRAGAMASPHASPSASLAGKVALRRRAQPPQTASGVGSGTSRPPFPWMMEAVELSVDQTGSNPEERNRLVGEHPGEDETVVVRGRLLGYLMPSRAFGDAIFKWPTNLQRQLLPGLTGRSDPLPYYLTPPYLTAEPVITRYKIDLSRDRFLVLATDGLFDELESEEIVEIVAGHMLSRGVLRTDGADGEGGVVAGDRWSQSDENAATCLIRNALGGRNEERLGRLLGIPAPYSRKFRDDITVNVIFFDDIFGVPSCSSSKPLNSFDKPHTTATRVHPTSSFKLPRVDVQKLTNPWAADTKLSIVSVQAGDPSLPQVDVGMADLKPQRLADIAVYLSPTSFSGGSKL
ncbi:hypothetical protein HDU67_003542 [Dinochytrium kinnereticum]|nr:hypothetical protein HDU67_003542 [Dinochytrium kinnereticum]